VLLKGSAWQKGMVEVIVTCCHEMALVNDVLPRNGRAVDALPLNGRAMLMCCGNL
jgi:hypothetical protein